MSSFDCIVTAHGVSGTLPTRYRIKAGDTLVAIAKRFGFADWRPIYNHPDNHPFRHKRPNPDKIFPGDELVIPGRPADPAELASLGYAGGGGAPFLRVPMALRLDGAGNILGIKKGPDPSLALDYVHPGKVKIRLTLFWLTNCVNPEASTKELLAKAEELYAPHGIGFDILPARARTAEHTIEAPVDLLLPEHYNAVRLEGARRYDDQTAGDKKPRLPVFFCEFKDPSNGLTIIGNWPPYVLVSGVLTPDKATLAHEIVHAAGIIGHDKAHASNILAEPTSSRSELFKFQVQKVAGAYFCK